MDNFDLEALAMQLLREDLRKILHSLTPKEQEVIRMRFGLDDGITRSIDQVAMTLKIDYVEVKSIEAKALLKTKEEESATGAEGSDDEVLNFDPLSND